MILIRGLDGRPLFTVEGQVARDANGKAIGQRVEPTTPRAKSAEERLAACAGRLMAGETQFLMDLATGDVATAATQASFGLDHGQYDWVADQVSAVKLIKKDRGVWYPETASDAIRLAEPTVSGDAQPPVVSPGFAPVPFTCAGYGLAAKLPRAIIDNADFDLRERTLRFLVEALKRSREYRVAQLLTTPANWAVGNQIAAAGKWNGGASQAPLTDVFAALAASYLPANVIVMPENAAPFFFANTSGQIRDFRQAQGEMPWHLMARGKFLQGGSPAYLWAPTRPANVAVLRTNDPCYPSSMTFRWLGDAGNDGAICDGMLVRTFRDDRDNSDWLVAAHYDAEVIVSNQIGALIVGALQ